jgi:dihydrolipoamide dehydrogenase
MCAPAGEHLAHYLSVLIQRRIDVFQALHLPIYHPVVEEGMRTALRMLAKNVKPHETPFELAICDSAAPEGLR